MCINFDFEYISGSKDLVEIIGQKNDNSEEVLALKIDKGKISGTNHFKNLEQSVSLMTGCKNVDDILFLRQKCADQKCSSLEKEVQISKLHYEGYKVIKLITKLSIYHT